MNFIPKLKNHTNLSAVVNSSDDHFEPIPVQQAKKFLLLKVLDPIGGWCEIRPYCSDTWKFLCASYKCPFFLLSATMEEDSLNRILGKSIPEIQITENDLLQQHLR